MFAYKFSKCATAEKPQTENTELLEKAMRNEALSRQEKDRIAEILYGLFGDHGSTYRLAGWAWHMSGVLPRILVRHTWDNSFCPHYAPDKTALRKVLYSVAEMVYA